MLALHDAVDSSWGKACGFCRQIPLRRDFGMHLLGIHVSKARRCWIKALLSILSETENDAGYGRFWKLC